MAVDALPARHEARQRALVGRLDLLAQRGQRGAPQAPQHLGVAPLAARAAGPQLAAHQLAGALEAGQHGREVEPVAGLQHVALERAVRAGVAAHEPLHRVRHVLEEDLREAGRRHGAERVAVEPGVLGGDPARLAAHPQAHGASLGGRAARARPRRRRRAAAPRRASRSPTRRSTSCMASSAVGARPLGQALEVGLDLLERRGVDQVAQLLLAEQLAQQVAVEREGGRAALRVRRVALVHVGGDVVEEQRGGERRGGRGLDLDEAQLARVQRPQQRLQAGDVEHVAQALAVGLEHDRELRVALGDLEQRLALEALLPQRRAPPGVRARDQQRAAGVLAEARAEQRASRRARRPRGPRARRARSSPARRRAARRRRGGGR